MSAAGEVRVFFGDVPGLSELIDELRRDTKLVEKAAAVARLYPIGTLVQNLDRGFWNDADEVGVVLEHYSFPPGGIGVLYEKGKLGQYSPLDLSGVQLLRLSGSGGPVLTEEHQFETRSEMAEAHRDGHYVEFFCEARRRVATMMRRPQ